MSNENKPDTPKGPPSETPGKGNPPSPPPGHQRPPKPGDDRGVG